MIGRIFGKKKEKVCVLGIDGVPCSLLERFISDGTMPNLKRLAQDGTLSSMTASIPEVSSTSWSTFMTGVNPGRHGIYGFMELQHDSYQWKFPNSNDIRSDTIWQIAGRHGKRSIVLNVPSTYPARELNGILTAGFVALDLKKATYPDSAYNYLNSIGYRMDVNTARARESDSVLAKDIMKTFEIRKKAILYFMDNEQWDLFIGVITETDRLHHYLWNALEDINHSQHEFFIDFYRSLDNFIGELQKRVNENIPFVIVSDHGFTTIKREVYLNTWLKEKGYIKFSKKNPESFVDMDPSSKMFALDPARFYIHMKDKFAKGNVSDSEYHELRNKLKSDLLAFEIDGENIIESVFFKEDIYNGPFFDQAPDVVALSEEGYDLKGSINKTEISGKGFLTGGHTRDNAVFFINRKIQKQDINIVDVGPTIMSLLGIKEDFDGRCLI